MEQDLMTKIDNAANMWNKTKDPYYKNLWYKLVKEFANGPYSIKRRIVSTHSSYQRDIGRNSINTRR